MESALAFGNGRDARACFGWVGDAIQSHARAAQCTPKELAALEWSDDWIHIGAPELRWRFRVTLGRASERSRERREAPGQQALDDWFTEQLAAAQIVVKARMIDGEISEVAIARVNSVERCIAYAIRLYLRDAHSFRRAVKQCPFLEHPIDDPLQAALNWHSDENIVRMPHWFLQWPVTKQRFCTIKHANAHRQRLFRLEQSAARKHK